MASAFKRLSLALLGFAAILPVPAHAQTTAPAAAPSSGESPRPREPAPAYQLPMPPVDQVPPPESRRRADPVTSASTRIESAQVLPRLATGQAYRERVGFFFRLSSGPTFLHVDAIQTAKVQYPGFGGTSVEVDMDMGGAATPKLVFSGFLSFCFLFTAKEITLTSTNGGEPSQGSPSVIRGGASVHVYPSANSGFNVGARLGVMSLLPMAKSSNSTGTSSSTATSTASSNSSAKMQSAFGDIHAGYDLTLTPTFSLALQAHAGMTLFQLENQDAPFDATWLGLRIGATYL